MWSDILEDRFRVRGQKTAFQKNLERLKRMSTTSRTATSISDRLHTGKKQGKPLESESDEEVSEVEDDTPFRGAKPHAEISDGTDNDEEENEDQDDDRMSEDDFIVEDDGAPSAELPAEFSMETHQDLSHQFKKIFQFFVHIATHQSSDRHEFMLNLLESMCSIQFSTERTPFIDGRSFSNSRRGIFLHPVEGVPQEAIRVARFSGCLFCLAAPLQTCPGEIPGLRLDSNGLCNTWM